MLVDTVTVRSRDDAPSLHNDGTGLRIKTTLVEQDFEGLVPLVLGDELQLRNRGNPHTLFYSPAQRTDTRMGGQKALCLPVGRCFYSACTWVHFQNNETRKFHMYVYALCIVLVENEGRLVSMSEVAAVHMILTCTVQLTMQ
eukprot:COSAG02_NODE_7336_length_3058_cov_1.304157_3_plen_142_part_00